jgi:hypothetical protein
VKINRTRLPRIVFGAISAAVLVSMLAAYHYYRATDHLIYETQDQATHVRIRVLCRWDGGETYHPFVLITTLERDLELYRTIVGCGVDTLSDCKNSQGDCGIKALSINRKDNSLVIEYQRKPTESFPLPERLKDFLHKT